MRFLFLLAACVALLSAGCKPRNPDASSTPGPPGNGLKARLEAARAIAYAGDRDQALAAVARDAAKAGDGAVTKAALSGIVFTSAKDEAAADCALKLASAGQGAAANEIAQLITFTGTRDATLKKLATGGR